MIHFWDIFDAIRDRKSENNLTLPVWTRSLCHATVMVRMEKHSACKSYEDNDVSRTALTHFERSYSIFFINTDTRIKSSFSMEITIYT